MSLFKCKMCGGDLEIAVGLTIAECEYCGTKQTVPKAMNENMQNLFNRANILRIKSEFDKAEKLYERIIQADTTQSEAYWGLILCKYGIEYVDDPTTFKKIPTCHRTSYDSIIADDDYKSALENADMSQRAIYEEQAKEIDRIQKDILALAQKEETYDVFICYKETDADGKRTQDSAIANDIYHQLTIEGFKVFYAAITLEGKLGSAYEPIIFAALNSAKVMLSIGTKPEYFNAVWVKNEWSRFLKIIKKDRSKLLIPCYRDMDAYELPEEFAHLQALDMAKIGFINDLVRGIKKVVNRDESKYKETVVTPPNVTVAPLLKRAFMFLEDGDFDRADEFCEQVLNQNPECAEAYVGKLMAELHVIKQEKLKDQAEPYDNNSNYKKAIRFADEKLKNELTDYIEYINTRNENTRLEGIYNQATNAMRSAKISTEYEVASNIFKTILNYKDSEILVTKCLENAKRAKIEETEKAEILRKDYIYNRAIALMNKPAGIFNKFITTHYEEAIKEFQSIIGWKDTNEKIILCQQKIAELKAQAEAEKERRAEFARKEAERIAKRNKKIGIAAAIVGAIIALIITFIIVLYTVIIPNSKYNDAIALMEAGNVVEAYEALIELDGYKDSADKANSIYDKYKVEKLKAAKVGDYVLFGLYEQDNNTANGKEDVEWLVLEVKDGKALVISKYALDCKRYNESDKDIAWATCTLRKWLNDEFINSAFTAYEKAMIPTATVSADKNPYYSTNPSYTTQDKVFLLSIVEANKYFSSDSARQCQPTEYAVAGGAYVNSSNGNCWWWLRSPGSRQTFATDVKMSGDVDEGGHYVTCDFFAVRPALWIDLNS